MIFVNFIPIKDRIKRIIVRSDGHNVWPSKIEQIIEAHPKVTKCCVTGVKEDSNHNGEIPTAFIVIDKNYLSETEEDASLFGVSSFFVTCSLCSQIIY